MKKKGFTLIELMIVLAVIAILAVVLVPKAGQAKNNAKNTGVTTNVNAVRAYLENKAATKFETNAATLATALQASFPTADASIAVTNPFSNDMNVVTTLGSVAPAVFVTTNTSFSPSNSYAGSVIVIIDAGAYKYTVYGVDNTGSMIGTAVTIAK